MFSVDNERIASIASLKTSSCDNNDSFAKLRDRRVVHERVPSYRYFFECKIARELGHHMHFAQIVRLQRSF